MTIRRTPTPRCSARGAPRCLAAAVLLACGAGHAAITCSTVTATSVSGTYAPATGLDLVGNFSVTCARAPGDPTTQNIYITVDQGLAIPAGRTMPHTGGGPNMAYSIFRNASYTGSWTTAGGVGPGAANAGALKIAFDFPSPSATLYSIDYPYYFRVAPGLNKQVGSYQDTVGVGVALAGNGAAVANGSFTTSATVLGSCSISTPPSTLVLAYASYSTAAATGVTPFGVNCTRGTNYTMDLNATSGSLLGISFSLAVVNPLSKKPVAGSNGTGVEQSWQVIATAGAGQVGTCATGSCTAQVPRTLTITY